ncbi:YfjI family protein [Bacteroides salyersiae]|nr:YfjI family protein [Bacteroides salyersiae]
MAPAGTGKGVVALAALLSQPLHDQYARKAADERKAYDTKKLAWEEEPERGLSCEAPCRPVVAARRTARDCTDVACQYFEVTDVCPSEG